MPPILLGLALALALACTPPEERAERAREVVQESIARGDRQAALDAIGDLRGIAEDTADAQLELAQLLIRAPSHRNQTNSRTPDPRRALRTRQRGPGPRE